MGKFNLKTSLGVAGAFLLMLFSVDASAQGNTVKGVVTGSDGLPLAGVSVYIEGETRGTVTNAQGEYTIAASAEQSLTYRFLGYDPVTELVGTRTTINIVLSEEQNIMDEIIVVGYGVQKRRDVVGAIEQIGGEIFENRSNPSITRSLQGEVPGVNIVMTDGKPSRNPNIKIRGHVTSIGAGGDALVLVDGVDADLSTVNPDDVETITFLKDASSTAVYGAKGTFGVILITTKKPQKGSLNISYSGSFSLLQRTFKPELVTNGLQYTDSFYDHWYGYHGSQPANFNNVFLTYAEGWDAWYDELKKRDADPTLEKWRINSKGYYEYYGNTDWHDIIYKDVTWATQHNITLSGAGEKSTFYISGRFYEQDGIYTAGDEDFKQFNVRAKGTLQLKSWLRFENSTDFTRRNQHEPLVMYSDDQNDMNKIFPIQRQLEQQAYPMAIPKNPDGTWTHTSAYIGWAGFNEGTSWRKTSKFDLRNTTAINIDFIKDRLVGRAEYSYYYNYTNRDQTGGLYTAYTGPTTTVQRQSFSYLENRNYNREYHTANATLTYTPKFRNEDHNLSVMGGWGLEEQAYTTKKIFRKGLLIDDKPSFTLMDGEGLNVVDNGSWDWGTVGVFYRASYSYKGKYLIETSGRYDGSSKFPKGQIWGFFPSASAGYRISEENFIKDNAPWVENIKIRGSVGSSGSTLISDPYLFNSSMSVSRTSVLIDGDRGVMIGLPTIVPKKLTWETSTTYNVGLDVDLFQGRLNFVGDIYRRVASDMYVAGQEIPAVAGYGAPRGNFADMRTDGYELSLAWRDSFTVGGKNFSYRAKVSFWDSQTKITRYTSETNLLPTIYTNPQGTGSRYYEGMTLGEIWGFRFDGFFEDAAHVANSADQSTFFKNTNSNGAFEAGDMKFKDLNDDGFINPGSTTLEDHGDMEKIGNVLPRYQYGINVSANWNGIGVSMFWQGIGKRDWYPAKESSYFWGQYGRPYGFALPWHNPSNQAGVDEDGKLTNPNAYWPRRRAYVAEVTNGPMSHANDHFLQDASYIRLKNLTVDYTFPTRIAHKLKLNSLRVFLSGDNLLTFTPLKKWGKNFDPEVVTAGDPDYLSSAGYAGDGYSYPMMKTYTIGINITF